MSSDTMPCGCEGHADNEYLCKYPALETALNEALTLLRSSHRKSGTAFGEYAHWHVVSEAIQKLEKIQKDVS